MDILMHIFFSDSFLKRTHSSGVTESKDAYILWCIAHIAIFLFKRLTPICNATPVDIH